MRINLKIDVQQAIRDSRFKKYDTLRPLNKKYGFAFEKFKSPKLFQTGTIW